MCNNLLHALGQQSKQFKHQRHSPRALMSALVMFYSTIKVTVGGLLQYYRLLQLFLIKSLIILVALAAVFLVLAGHCLLLCFLVNCTEAIQRKAIVNLERIINGMHRHQSIQM